MEKQALAAKAAPMEKVVPSANLAAMEKAALGAKAAPVENVTTGATVALVGKEALGARLSWRRQLLVQRWLSLIRRLLVQRQLPLQEGGSWYKCGSWCKGSYR